MISKYICHNKAKNNWSHNGGNIAVLENSVSKQVQDVQQNPKPDTQNIPKHVHTHTQVLTLDTL
jgi:hypothetical protein